MSNPNTNPISTIIVAPELYVNTSEGTPLGASDEAWSSASAVPQSPSTRDGTSTVRAKRLAESVPLPARANPTAQFPRQEVTVRLVRRRFDGGVPVLLAVLGLSFGLWASATWLPVREPVASAAFRAQPSARTPIAPAAARATARSVDPVPHFSAPSKPLAISTAPLHRPALSVSKVAVLWGRTNQPIRALHAAFNRSSEKTSACVSLTEPIASTAAVAVSMRIRANGSILWARPSTDAEELRPALECIARALRAATFPRSQGGLRVDAELAFRVR